MVTINNSSNYNKIGTTFQAIQLQRVIKATSFPEVASSFVGSSADVVVNLKSVPPVSEMEDVPPDSTLKEKTQEPAIPKSWPTNVPLTDLSQLNGAINSKNMELAKKIINTMVAAVIEQSKQPRLIKSTVKSPWCKVGTNIDTYA